MSVSVGAPLVLLALVLCPLLWLAARSSRYHASRRRLGWVTATRVGVVALIVLALADVRLELPTDDLAVATVVDRSASVSAEEQAAVDRDLAMLRATHPAVRWHDVQASPQTVDDDGALARAAGVAVASLPTDRVRRLMIATDGRDPTGDLPRAILDARRAGVEVSVLPMGDSPPADAVAVSAVEVPRLVRAGETLDVEVELHAAVTERTTLRAELDGEEVASEEVGVAPGESAAHLSVTFPEEEGVVELTVSASTPGDPLPDNDRTTTLVRVLTRPRVLIVHEPDTEPLLAQVLDDAELEVETRSRLDAPADPSDLDRYGLVVLDEIDPGDLAEEQQRSLRTFVEEMGGGLVDATGTHAVRRQPQLLREIEPVQPPPAVPEPRPLELVLVIDRSSSMDGGPIAQARQAGIAAIRALREDALVGVVAFSGGADYVMEPVDHERFEEATGFISRITAGGGTNIAAALGAARRIMSDDDRYIHHVILLSDGESDPASAIAQAQQLAGSGVSISAITLGPYSHLMAQIARIGRGRYHVTRSAGSLPSLFVREAQYRQPPAHKQLQLRPRVAAAHPIVDGIDFDAGPTLGGHTLGEPKRGATMLLATPSDESLLSHWHVGLGQVAVWCSSTSGGWANDMRRWPGFRTLWSQLAWSMLRGRTVEPLEVSVLEVPGEPALRDVLVTGPTVGSAPVPVATLSRDGDDEGALELAEAGPGMWRARVPVERGFLVTARLPGDPEPTAAAGEDASYPAELARFGVDADALARWAEIGGGRVLTVPGQALESVTPRAVERSMRTPMLALALVLYLLGLLLLRLPDRRAAVEAPRIRRAPAARPRGRETPPRKEAA